MPPTTDLLRIRIQLNGRDYSEDLAASAIINPDLDGLNTALAEHPSRFAWWATLEVFARAQYEDLSGQLTALDAELFSRYSTLLRSTQTKEGKGREPTLDAIKSRITLDKPRRVLSERMAQAKKEYELVQVGRRTMEQRKDALTAIASNMRAEMDHKMYVGKSRAYEAAAAFRNRGEKGLTHG